MINFYRTFKAEFVEDRENVFVELFDGFDIGSIRHGYIRDNINKLLELQGLPRRIRYECCIRDTEWNDFMGRLTQAFEGDTIRVIY